MSAERYVRLVAAADPAAIRTATFEGRQHLVVPVVALVGGAVIEPVGSDGPELVPAEVLASAPGGWNGRPVMPDHPEGGRASANEPARLEAERMGWLFNCRFEDNLLKVEAWIDTERAGQIGGVAAEVLRRFLAGERVEVSVGCYISYEERPGTTAGGQRYGIVWTHVVPDHLAMLPAGSVGACSIDMGCGAPRAAKEAGMADGEKTGERAAIMAQARRPTFSGTETSAWSTPSFGDYMRYLHPGADAPTSVAACPMALRREIAAHTLLGDPEAESMRDLSFFPVVNPATGKLNERALRAVISGRGSQADIPERAKASAQDMARRLLNSEFGAELEAAQMKTTSKILAAVHRLVAQMGGLTSAPASARAAAAGMSDSELRAELYNALRATVPAFMDVYEVYPDDGLAIYMTSPPEGEMCWWRVSFTVDAAGKVALASDAVQVEPEYNWVPVGEMHPEGVTTASALAGLLDRLSSAKEVLTTHDVALLAALPDQRLEQLCMQFDEVHKTINLNTPVGASGADGAGDGAGRAASADDTRGGNGMSNKKPDLIARLLKATGTPFREEDTKTLEQFSEERLTAMCDCQEAKAAAVEPAPKPAADPESVTLSKDELEELRGAAAAHRAAQEQAKAELVARLTSAQDAFTAAELAAKPVEELRKLDAFVAANAAVPDYSAIPVPVKPGSGDDPAGFAPPDPYKSLLQKGAN